MSIINTLSVFSLINVAWWFSTQARSCRATCVDVTGTADENDDTDKDYQPPRKVRDEPDGPSIALDSDGDEVFKDTELGEELVSIYCPITPHWRLTFKQINKRASKKAKTAAGKPSQKIGESQAKPRAAAAKKPPMVSISWIQIKDMMLTQCWHLLWR